MGKMFIIATKNATKQQQREIADLLKGMGVGWWHHFPNTWLVSTGSSHLTPTQLRDAIKTMSPAPTHYVLEVNKNVSWAGFAAPTSHAWIKAQWKK